MLNSPATSKRIESLQEQIKELELALKLQPKMSEEEVQSIRKQIENLLQILEKAKR
jgi:ElaB/YqjD/DUF883 family membrane-anchored ribosome-binding protein